MNRDFISATFLRCERLISPGRHIRYVLKFSCGHRLEFCHSLTDDFVLNLNAKGYLDAAAIDSMQQELKHALDSAQELARHPHCAVAKLSWRAIFKGVWRKIRRQKCAIQRW